MTYLQLVNKVLVRLRETTVTTVNENAYSALVGEFVNDAKRMVEDAWNWSHLRSTQTYSVVSDVDELELTNLSGRSKIVKAFNTTDKVELTYKSRDWFNNQKYLGDAVSGSTSYYTYKTVNTSDNVELLLFPSTGTGNTTFVFDCVVKQDDLSSDSTVLQVPYTPVIDLAVAMAARERGETGGTSAAELFMIADKSLADAISIDSMQHPEELVYVAV